MRHIKRLPLPLKLANQLASKTSNVFRLSSRQSKKLYAVLLESQKNLCCYCECLIDINDNHHFEHFQEQHDAPELRYDYINLLLSCEGNTKSGTKNKENNSCGHCKTKSFHNDIEIDYNLLLNPCINNEKLFYYSDGLVEASKNCLEEDAEKVNYTINRLKLDTLRLELDRKREIRLIQNQLEDLSPEEQYDFINNLLDVKQLKLTQYYSTIKDMFSFILNSST